MKECTSKSPVNATLKVIGGKWKSLILWSLSKGTMRFGQLNREIAGVTQKMLTQQLRELEEDGLVVRTVYPEVPPRVEYSISDYGKTLAPVLDSMAAWGNRHIERKAVK
ncbi:MAG: helix-turn-helix domain-containing protein [Candidatus Dojkabacteria bacterium]